MFLFKLTVFGRGGGGAQRKSLILLRQEVYHSSITGASTVRFGGFNLGQDEKNPSSTHLDFFKKIDHGGHAMPNDAMKLLVFGRFFRFSFDIFNKIKKKS